MTKPLNTVPFVSVEGMMQTVLKIGLSPFLRRLAEYIEEDYARWAQFDKTPRVASHGSNGVIELMPISDHSFYSFKYVNGHPRNFETGRQTVTAFGVLSDVATGYPVLLSEMTLLTAFRTAAMSALAAKCLAPKSASSMALIGNGAQAEFQALAFREILGIHEIHLQDIDPTATAKCERNLLSEGFKVYSYGEAEAAVENADIVTTITADKQLATILTDNMIGSGVHINAVGGDCPGKTELHRDILARSDIFVEYEPQTRIEGELQQMASDHPATELWRVIAGEAPGRVSRNQITLFDSVGFAIEDFSALRYVRDEIANSQHATGLDLLADPDDPRDLFGMLMRAKARSDGVCAIT